MELDSPVYVYIAGPDQGRSSYVGIAPTLVDMPWIVELGVDRLLWFEAYEPNAASTRAKELRNMSVSERESVFLRHNPDRLDLTSRIWASDPED